MAFCTAAPALAALHNSPHLGLPHSRHARTTTDMPTLLDPITIGDLRLPNRIIMAPLTRNRSSGPGRVPNALMRDYYVQRASAGLIISEATSVDADGRRLSAYARRLVAGAGRGLALDHRGRA